MGRKVRYPTANNAMKPYAEGKTGDETLVNHEGVEHVTQGYWYALQVAVAATKTSANFDSGDKLLLGPCDALVADAATVVTINLYDDQTNAIAVPLPANTPIPYAMIKYTSQSGTATITALFHRKPNAQASEPT